MRWYCEMHATPTADTVKIVGMDIVARKARAGLIGVKRTNSGSNWNFSLFTDGVWRYGIILIEYYLATRTSCARGKGRKFLMINCFLFYQVLQLWLASSHWNGYDSVVRAIAEPVSRTHTNTQVASAQWNSQDETFLLQNSESILESDSHVIFHSMNFSGIQIFASNEMNISRTENNNPSTFCHLYWDRCESR